MEDYIMGTFELDKRHHNNHDDVEDVQGAEDVQGQQTDRRRIKQECIIAFKVYDQCRQQDCLTPDIIGPARAACTTTLGGVTVQEGEIIPPPSDAAAVTIDDLRLKKIIIVDKEPNQFKPGYWDIDLKYVFKYTLTFREADGDVIGCIKANSIFNKKVTLFGSVGSDIVIGTDLLGDQSDTLDADPFVLSEGKAVALDAELKYCPCRKDCCEALSPESNQGAVEVLVTIGLFTIVKLFRIVQLTVESRGFCIPRECEEVSPLNPCEFFDSIDFPMDIFAPPQIEDFNVAGAQQDNRRKRRCGCDN